MKDERVPGKDTIPYSLPVLVVYGHIGELTQGTGSKNIDAVAGRRKN